MYTYRVMQILCNTFGFIKCRKWENGNLTCLDFTRTKLKCFVADHNWVQSLFEGAFFFAIIMFPQDLYAKFVLNTAFSFFYHLRYFRFCIKMLGILTFKYIAIWRNNFFVLICIIDLSSLLVRKSQNKRWMTLSLDVLWWS